MKFLSNTKRTRFKITVIVVVYMMIMGAWSLFKDNTDVTVIALGVIASSVGIYGYGETKRKSEIEEIEVFD